MKLSSSHVFNAVVCIIRDPCKNITYSVWTFDMISALIIVAAVVCMFQARWPSTCRTPVTAALKARTRGARGWAAEEEAGAAPGWRLVALTLWPCLPWETQLRRGGTALPPSWSWWTVSTTPPLTCWETSQRTREGKRERRTVTKMRAPTGGVDTASKQWKYCLSFHSWVCWSVNVFNGNCWLVLQMGEGIPAELSIHWKLTYVVPPSSRKDAFLLPAHGQGIGFKWLAIFMLQVHFACHPPWPLCFSPSLVTTPFLRMLAPTASKTNWSLCPRRVQGTVCTTSLCLYGPTTDPGRSSTPLFYCWRACKDTATSFGEMQWPCL